MSESDGSDPAAGDLRRRILASPTPTAALAVLAGLVVFGVARVLFPHHSSNHDEAVYLQQAAMLLEGQLTIEAGPIAEAVRPWFFVQEGSTLYPKYAPVTAGVFAVGMAVGVPRLSLALVAAGIVALTVALGRLAFDRTTGLLAGALLLASPGFLYPASTFLPYAPTTLLNLGFALAYLRARRRDSIRWAALAGALVGTAFFARPYTAVLFAAPLIAHACWTLWATWDTRRFHGTLARQGATAALGAAGVALTLGYNALLTGDPLVFPYQAFAPQDGIGFGRRQILGYERTYTPALGLRANVTALWYLATRWSPLAPVGAAAALSAAAVTLWRSRGWRPDPAAFSARTLRLTLLGVVATVCVGNVFFWGTLNTLADIGNPTNGLVALFGPFYHYDLQPVLAVYGATGLLAAWRRGRTVLAARFDRRTALAVTAAVLLAAAPVLAVATVPNLTTPADRHSGYTERYEDAYAPFDDDPPENAVVFVPPAYGEWLNHPFQSLRNDPDLDGPRVSAIHRGPDDFAVVDAYPDRDLYRYTYNGEWTPDPSRPIYPRLRRVETVERDRLTASTTVAIPEEEATVRVTLSTANGSVERTLPAAAVGDELTVEWSVGPDGATLAGASGVAPLSDRDEVDLAVTLSAPRGATLTYRERVSVRRTAAGVEALWPPRTSVCTLVTDCGREGRYLPDRPDLFPRGVAIETTLTNESEAAALGAVVLGDDAKTPPQNSRRRCSSRQTVTMDFAIA